MEYTDEQFEVLLRAEFERQHAGRDLTRHSLRGTYVRANIAALWNQHVRTAQWVRSVQRRPNPAHGAPRPPGHHTFG